MRYSLFTGAEGLHHPTKQMTNAQKNYSFIRSADVQTRDAIFAAIGSHYGISRSEVQDEVTGADAEHLLDYLTGSVRTATSLLMRRAGLA